jgi:demethylmenaquinone methyltransferase/2-methoxy-6-polyprenyl-1,4-benzoquinol methylase
MENERNGKPEKAAETDLYAQKLALSDLLREQVIRSAIRALELPLGSLGLDAGCGIGSHTLLLAEAVGPGGRVIGLDLSSGLLRLFHLFHVQRLQFLMARHGELFSKSLNLSMPFLLTAYSIL